MVVINAKPDYKKMPLDGAHDHILHKLADQVLKK